MNKAKFEQIRERIDTSYNNDSIGKMYLDVVDLMLENTKLRLALEAIESGVNLIDKANDMGINTSKIDHPIMAMMAIARKALE